MCDVTCDLALAANDCCLCCSVPPPGVDLDLAAAVDDDDWFNSAATRDIICESIPAGDRGWWYCTKRDMAFNLAASAER